jgi:hypothetical protein
MDGERMSILKQIEAGEITAEEAVWQINSLEQAPQAKPEERVRQYTVVFER